ncbi:hypothetical protein SAY87_002984 [Trapa incisa]|uniref:PHD-type domain-containing protein n=1 Tax=Trapa incisa TaxID=236973 RepID=A0AAN7KNC7_9MYRT|nr:hypothetical protein SAY87_002984 [Trapa incisa]
MRVKSKPISSLSQQSFSCSSSRTRKKHKRLDAICENTYNENHGGSSETKTRVSEDTNDVDAGELRRSTRSRRAPVILDSSPPPARKRRKLDNIGKASSARKEKFSPPRGKANEGDSFVDAETPDSWKFRLKPRGKKRVNSRFPNKVPSPPGKRKLFVDTKMEDTEDNLAERKITEEEKGEIDLNTAELRVGNPSPVKKKRQGKIKAAAPSEDEESKDVMNAENSMLEQAENEGNDVISLEDREKRGFLDTGIASEDGDKRDVLDKGIASEDGDKRDVLDPAEEVGNVGIEIEGHGDGSEQDLHTETDGCIENEVQIVNVNETALTEREGEEEIHDAASAEVESTGDDSVTAAEHAEEVMEKEEDDTYGINGTYHKQVDEECVDRVQGKSHDIEDVNMVKLDQKPAESGQSKKIDTKVRSSSDITVLSFTKGGRRCGLCGGGTDGKLPKKLMNEIGDSENEAFNGSSPSEEPNYEIWDGFGDEPTWLGRLLGPINDRYGIAGIWVHQHCAVWSPEVYFAGLGCLKNVRAALCRGRALKCTRCGRPGATIGCRVDRCPKTYHLPCARANGCIFDHRKFLIACTDHRHFFQPHGIKNSNWLKRMRAKKLKSEFRKLSNDASRKDIEAEEKWLENCGEDEEFLKRESRRLHRDLLRISPVYIGGGNAGDGNGFEGWDSVAGLQDVVRCMKEVVILPLLYPEFFDNLGLTPPRGVLLHGYPGTGKTLVVRALIGACARGDKRIAYFARKGADCLGKYVGDAERQLRLLFQVAEKCQPSIIFFDEIDGLAPRRTKQQDQTHSSVVSTLLALLDGLKSRGSVVVIGATNRPDAIDPALRRPGRFDREIYFPLPSLGDRAEILSLHTKKWPKPVLGSLLQFIAQKTAGFAGADLQALCTQAAMIALKRNFPLQETLSAAGKNSGADRIPLPSFAVEERDWLEALSCSPPPCSRREAGIAANDIVSSPLPTHLFPCLMEPLSQLLILLHLDENLCLPPALSGAALRVKNIIFSNMEKRKLPVNHWKTHLQDCMQDKETEDEIGSALSSTGLLIGQSNFVNDYAHIDDSQCNFLQSEPSLTFNQGTQSFTSRNTSFALRKKSGYRLLISGVSGSGQRHLASCLLHSYVGNAEVQKIDLATVSQEGHGDALQGITQILMKCASVDSSVVFMPRIDLWAVETHYDIASEEEMMRPEDLQQISSQSWNSFIEQAESVCVNTSLVILATSDVSSMALPSRVRNFFCGDVQQRCSTNSEHAFPRFCINLGADVNFDVVMERSVAKLSNNLVQQYVQLIHQKIQLRRPLQDGNSDSTMKCSPGNVLSGGGETDPASQRSDNSLTKALQVSNKRNLKGKSNLMLAISAFGYQILRYPHFAELCWVTSKLKDGPIADIGGPWKGWPFNSCIIRPYTTTEEMTTACGPGNVKTEEKYGLVRGLMAVGLSAYKGMYGSAKEVSFGIRRVLEILVGQINAKIQAGKDKYGYVRILSQVSYLEDMVNSWAYSLQSLESDAQVIVPKAAPTNMTPPNENMNPEAKDLGPTMSGKIVEEEVQKGGAGLNTASSNCMQPDFLEGVPAMDEGHPSVGSSASDEHHVSPLFSSKLIDGKLTESDETNTSCPDSEPVAGDPVKALENRWILSEEGQCTSGFLKGVQTLQTLSSDSAAKSNETSLVGNSTCTSSASGTCFYRCCLDCISSLHRLMRQHLIQQWGLKKNQWTVEEFHDAVATLSVDLFSSLRKHCFSDYGSTLCDEISTNKPSELNGCSCRSSSSLVLPVECKCHSLSRVGTADGCSSGRGQPGLDTEFLIRNAVLDAGNPHKDTKFQCKLEALCLCSLSELDVFTKMRNCDTK